jgi:hypothetical protein
MDPKANDLHFFPHPFLLRPSNPSSRKLGTRSKLHFDDEGDVKRRKEKEKTEWTFLTTPLFISFEQWDMSSSV